MVLGSDVAPNKSPSMGKVMKINRLSQKKLNAIKNHEVLRKCWNFGSRILGVTPRDNVYEFYAVRFYYEVGKKYKK